MNSVHTYVDTGIPIELTSSHALQFVFPDGTEIEAYSVRIAKRPHSAADVYHPRASVAIQLPPETTS